LLAAISIDLAHEIAPDKMSGSTVSPSPLFQPRADVEKLDGPLILIERDDAKRSPRIVANGIDVETGLPLLALDAAAVRRIALEHQVSVNRQRLHRERLTQVKPKLGLIHGINYENLAAAGWAVIVHAQDDAKLIKALMPLIEHRAQQQGIPLPSISYRDGENCGEWLAHYISADKTYPSPWHPKRPVRLPVILYEGGAEYSYSTFLFKNGVMATTVDPRRGVPFYLLIAGRPGPLHANDSVFIPFDFQYDLDIFWGVGRLCFTNTSGQHDFQAYTAYAEQVVQFEQRQTPPYQKHIVYFATRHQRDESTEASEAQLVHPLAMGDAIQGIKPPASQYGFTNDLLIGSQATRTMLSDVLRGAAPSGKPALLFSATHGAGLRPANPRLPASQGALICQDWSGIGTVREEHWLAAEGLPAQLNVEGLIAILFACYSVGCPKYDVYAAAAGRVREIAPRDIVAALPQRLLAQGALAVIGHVDRAWSYSFSVPELNVSGQTQGFDDLLRRLMSSGRVGFATDDFNLRQAAFSKALSDYSRNAIFSETYKLNEIGAIWKAYQDARSYGVLGDPAVHLPFT
jgi:hypothetical protein